MKQWVAALRSGEYQQGQGYLNKQNKFCCLGVVCDLYIKSGGKGEWKMDATGMGRFIVKDAVDEAMYLPDVVRKWLIEDDFAAGQDLSELNPISLNDNRRLDFAQIADCIEEKFNLK